MEKRRFHLSHKIFNYFSSSLDPNKPFESHKPCMTTYSQLMSTHLNSIHSHRFVSAAMNFDLSPAITLPQMSDTSVTPGCRVGTTSLKQEVRKAKQVRRAKKGGEYKQWKFNERGEHVGNKNLS